MIIRKEIYRRVVGLIQIVNPVPYRNVVHVCHIILLLRSYAVHAGAAMMPALQENNEHDEKV